VGVLTLPSEDNNIHAVTHQGFELKVSLLVLAYGIEKAMF
jgi:hypothetical protein